MPHCRTSVPRLTLAQCRCRLGAPQPSTSVRNAPGPRPPRRTPAAAPWVLPGQDWGEGWGVGGLRGHRRVVFTPCRPCARSAPLVGRELRFRETATFALRVAPFSYFSSYGQRARAPSIAACSHSQAGTKRPRPAPIPSRAGTGRASSARRIAAITTDRNHRQGYIMRLSRI